MKVMKQGEVNCPDIPAHGAGTLTIPAAVKGPCFDADSNG